MIRRPPSSTRTHTLCPSSTLFRSDPATKMIAAPEIDGGGRAQSRSQHCACDAFMSPDAGNRRTAAFIRSMALRSEEHTSELQSLMRNSYAVFCLIKKKISNKHHKYHITRKELIEQTDIK